MISRELKTRTQSFHELLEKQYPFSRLTDEKIQAEVLEDYLICFKLMFQNYLKQKLGSHHFFLECYQFFFSHRTDLNLTLQDHKIQASHPLKDLHYDYLFLGSHFGNKFISRKNPAILESVVKNYFNIEMPKELWVNFIETINCDLNQNEAEILIINSQYAFRELINYGIFAEQRRSQPLIG